MPLSCRPHTHQRPDDPWLTCPRALGSCCIRDLILGYYDAYASGAPAAVHTWLGPEEKRDPRRHSMETEPEGMV